MSDTLITIIALGICAVICFRIAWEERRWPRKPGPSMRSDGDGH